MLIYCSVKVRRPGHLRWLVAYQGLPPIPVPTVPDVVQLLYSYADRNQYTATATSIVIFVPVVVLGMCH